MVFLQIRKKQSHFNSGEKYLSNRNRDMWKLYIYKKKYFSRANQRADLYI